MKNLMKNLEKLERKRKYYAAESCSKGISQGLMLRFVQKRMLVEAKIAYNKGEFASMYEARKSVASLKQLKLCMEGLEATGPEYRGILGLSSKEVLDYLA